MKYSRNKISITGTLTILFSLSFLSLFEYRPNRVLSGTGIYARELLGGIFYLLLAISIVVFVLLVLNKDRYKVVIGILTLFLVLLFLYQLGFSLEKDIYNQTPGGRMSLGRGFWCFLLGIIMLVTGTFNVHKEDSIFRRLIFFAIFLIFFVFLLSGHLSKLSIMKEFFNRSDTFYRQISRHFSLSFLSVIISLIIGIPTGLFVYKMEKPNSPILFIINLGQTIPTLSLLGIIMALLTFFGEKSELLRNLGIRGVGFTPAFIVLIIYALFPIVHNTIAGLSMVDKNLLEAADAIGMEKSQVFWKVQIPLSLPVIFGGIRTAMTQSIGNTILAGLIGGGGLGSIIFLGLAQAAPDLILLGIIPLILMAFLLDSIISFFIFFYRKNYLGER